MNGVRKKINNTNNNDMTIDMKNRYVWDNNRKRGTIDSRGATY